MKDWLKRTPSYRSPPSSVSEKKVLDRSSSLFKSKGGSSSSRGSSFKESKFNPFRGSVRKKIQEFEANKEKKDEEKRHGGGVSRVRSVEDVIEREDPVHEEGGHCQGPSHLRALLGHLQHGQRCTSVEVLHESNASAEQLLDTDLEGEVLLGTPAEEVFDPDPKSSNGDSKNNQDERSSIDENGNDESIYVSRKLLMRQLMEQELKNSAENGEVDLSPDDDRSVTDSWSEMEENFTRIYEPVPFDIRMNSWRSMTKKQILSKVSSKRLVEEFQPLSRVEILKRIEHVRDLAFVGPHNGFLTSVEDNQTQKMRVVAQVHRDDRKGSLESEEELSEEEMSDQDVYEPESELQLDMSNNSEEDMFSPDNNNNEHHQQQESGGEVEDSISWRSVPQNEDGAEEPVYISRSEILSRHDPIYASRSEVGRAAGAGFQPIYQSRSMMAENVIHLPFPPVSRKAIINNAAKSSQLSHTLTRQLNGLNGKSTSYFSRAEVLSQLMEMRGSRDHPLDDAGLPEDEPVSAILNSRNNPEIGLSDLSRSESPTSLRSFDSWSLGDFNKIYEPVSKFGDASLNGPADERSYEVEAQLLNMNSLAEETESHALKKCDSKDSWSFSEAEEVNENVKIMSRAEILNKKMRLRESPALELQRQVSEILSNNKQIEAPTKEKVMNILSEHIKLNGNVESLADAEEKNQEVRDRLKEALAKDWETLCNVNLGFIYVPMEESTKHPSKLPKEATDYDTFGSLDSLIFEPKSFNSDSKIDSLNKLKNVAEGLVPERSESFHGFTEKKNSPSSEALLALGTPQALYSLSASSSDSPAEHEAFFFSGKEVDNEDALEHRSGEQNQSHTGNRSDRSHSISMKADFVSSTSPSGVEAGLPYDINTKADQSKGNAAHEVPEKANSPINKKKMLWTKFQRGFTDNFFKSGSKGSDSVLGISGTPPPLPRQVNTMRDSPIIYDYHPDNSEPVSSSSGNTSSSVESGSIESDTESITSIESVIYNAKYKKSPEVEEEKRKKSSKSTSKKYVVNQCTESDSNSELERGSNFTNQNVLDSDTSWDYVEPQKVAEMNNMQPQVSFTEVDRNSDRLEPTRHNNVRSGPMYQNINDDLNQSSNYRKTPFIKDQCNFPNKHDHRGDKSIYSARDTSGNHPEKESTNSSATEDENIYEDCEMVPSTVTNPPVTLLKHHVYQSLESLKGATTDGSSEAELQMYGSKHGEPIYGVKNSRLFKSMNGAYVDQNESEKAANDVPFVVRNGEIVPLTEEIFNGTKEREKAKRASQQKEEEDQQKETKTNPTYENSGEGCDEAKEDALENSKPRSEPPSEPLSTLTVNTEEKMKKVQKLGISLMGAKNNDLMIRELKLKLRRRFNTDDEGDEEYDEDEDEEKPPAAPQSLFKDGMSSVASKREQLAPHMNRIFSSLHLKHQGLGMERSQARPVPSVVESTSPSDEAKKDAKEIKQERNEREKGNVKSLEEDTAAVASATPSEDGDPVIWMPTPDYTPLSTLPRSEAENDDFPEELPLIFTEDEALGFDLTDLERFVKFHLGKNYAGLTSTSPESALVTEERRALRARMGSPKRSVRFDTTRPLPDATMGATWSDLESVIFAEDRSFSSETFEQGGRPSSALLEANVAAAMLRLPESRMESYKDDWLFWDQLAKMRRSKAPEDKERWETEKTKRMLLWIHLSNNNAQREWCYKSHWWKAKKKASVAWIVQKAHKNKVPSDIEEPYYKDYEGQERLKPGIVHRLSNADLYCSALANIYGDPNFHNLSHWNIIQALARKGVYVAEPTDVALTETVLIQTTPIKMSAHLAVIEAMMALYIREVVIAERVVQAIQRISGIPQSQEIPTPQDQEEALVLWVEHTTQALQARVHLQVQPTQDQELPVFPKIQDLSDLSDGIGLAALVAFYCPQEVSWGDIAVADPPSMADSLYNIGLVIKFCHESLPYNPCLLTKEDIVYMHSSVKQNILAFVAELFFLMELEPVSCVSIASTKKTSSKYIQLSSPGMKPAGVPSVRRSHSMNLNDVSDIRSRAESRSENAPSSHNSEYGGRESSSMSDGQEGEFLVQRAKGYATLGDMMRNQSSPRPSQTDVSQDLYVGSRGTTTKERYNIESKEEELGERRLSRRGSFYGSSQELNELPPAGIPSRFEQRPLGRSRSRRNSISAEESQLTIENFGGSQDNLNYISRNTDKDPYIHSGKRDSQSSLSGGGGAPPERPERRSTSQTRDAFRPSMDEFRSNMDELDNRVVDKLEKDALEREKRDRHYSSKEVLTKERRRGRVESVVDSSSESEASFDHDKPMSKATSFAELSKLKEQLPGGINIIYMQSERDDPGKAHSKEKKTTFAALPNQTTWKQQSAQSHGEEGPDTGDENIEPQIVSSELHNVKLKLEEKRRRIEAEKRKMELAMNKQRQKLGKEAFMQAVVKGDLGTEVSNVSKRWLEGTAPMEELRTPDMDAMDYDEYQKSLTQMTDSLTEIQTDIQRLSHQQHQIQSMMHNGLPNQPPQNVHPQHPNQFYLHDQQGSPARRMWNQQAANDGYSSMSPATRRAQWGPVRPMMPQGDYIMGGHPPPPQGGYYSYQMGQPPMQLPPLNQMAQQPPPQHPPPHNQGPGFMLHGQPQSLPAGHQPNMYQNGQNYYTPDQYRGYSNQGYGDPSRAPPGPGGNTPFRLHNEGPPAPNDGRAPSSLRSSAQSSPSRQPPHPQPQGPPQGPPPQPPRHQKSPSPSRQVSHAPVSAPPPDDMEPQNVCFIDSDEGEKLKRLSISSGSRTYRISPHEPGSPTRPPIGTKTFRVPTKKGTPVYDDSDLPQPSPPQRSLSPPYHQPHYGQQNDDEAPMVRVEPLQEGPKADKGFYISLDDNSGPKRPKPQLRTKKLSQKKNSAPSTPLSTPSREDAPPIPVRSPRNSSGALDSLSGSTSAYGSLKLRRDSSSRSMLNSMASPTYSSTVPTFPSRSDVTLSPSSSASSIPARANPSSYWDRRSSRDKLNNNNNNSSNNNNHNSYNYDDYQQGSDTGSDVALDEVIKVVSKKNSSDTSTGMALVIGEDLVNEDSSLSEMEKKKEKLMMMSIRRKQQQEEMKRKKEMEAEIKREEEKVKEDQKLRKKEEEKARRELILEKHKIKKAIEEAEKEGRHYTPPAWYTEDSGSNTPTGKSSSVRMRHRAPGGAKPRPKTMHEASFTGSEERLASRGKKGSSQNIAADSRSVRKSSGRWGSSQSLSRASGSRGSTGSLGPDYGNSSISRNLDRHSGRRPTSVIGSSGSLQRRGSKGSIYGSRGAGMEVQDAYQVRESRRPSLASPRARYPYNAPNTYDSSGSASTRKYRSTGNLYGANEHDSLLYHMSEDSGLGRATPPRRAPSPGMSSRHLPSPSGPGSLPPGLFSRRRPGAFDDNMSDISTTSSNMDYCGPRLFKQPTAKSNRSIILNAVEYCVFPGVVNQTAKHRVIEEVSRSESKHFLILFRDVGCQFRALYSYNPDLEEVYKLYGTGPKQVTDRMFDKFFKYNSGGKCFSQIHTKHLTVTIDAFTIHNSLWQGKKVNLPSKKDMKLVI